MPGPQPQPPVDGPVRQTLPDQKTRDLIDAVFNLKIEAKHRLQDLATAVHNLTVGYDLDEGSILATADTLRRIYDDADEALAAIRAIVEADVIDKVRTLLDAGESTP